MEEQEKHIIEGALSMYLKFGVKSVNMDDIAREMGVSKKTIYKYVCNKGQLVDRCCIHFFNHISRLVEDITGRNKNAIEDLFEIDAALGENFKAQQPAAMYQLQKYYPKTYEKVTMLRREFMLRITRRNLEKGIRQGYYRKEIDIAVIAQLYYCKVLMLNDEQFFRLEDANIRHLTSESLIYHIRGIASPQGIAYLEQKLRQQP